MRRIGPVTVLVLTAGCAQILGVDEEWQPPSSAAGVGGAATTSAAGTGGGPTTSTAGAGGPGAGGAGGLGGGGAGGADCPGIAERKTDPKHCGSCGHDCLGGDCEGGVCKPVSIYEKELLPGDTVANCNLIVDGSHVYLAVPPTFDKVGVVVRFKKDGSELKGGQILATVQLSPFGLAVDEHPEGYLYFANWAYSNDGSVFRVRKNAGQTDELELVTDEINPTLSSLAYQNGKLFVPTWSNLQAFAVGKDGPPFTGGPLADGMTDDVEIDAKYVYWIDRTNKQLRRMTLGGVEPLDIAPVDNSPGRLARGGATLYFSSWASSAAIHAVGTAGENLRRIHTEPHGVWSLAADDTHVYWTTKSAPSNSVRRKPKDAGEADLEELLAGDVKGSPVVALGEDAVYWCAFQGATISVHKLAK